MITITTKEEHKNATSLIFPQREEEKDMRMRMRMDDSNNKNYDGDDDDDDDDDDDNDYSSDDYSLSEEEVKKWDNDDYITGPIFEPDDDVDMYMLMQEVKDDNDDEHSSDDNNNNYYTLSEEEEEEKEEEKCGNDDFISGPLLAPNDNNVMNNIGLNLPLTQDEADLVDNALTKEVAQLTMVDHEKAIFDVHGLDRCCCLDNDLDESTNYLENKIVEFNHEMNKLLLRSSSTKKHKAFADTMKQVMELHPSYVNSKILMFLRSERFDAKLAAEKMIVHFAVKKDLFVDANDNDNDNSSDDDEILGRDVKLSDLSPTDMNVLESGMFQTLPVRDTGGRFVFVVRPAIFYQLKGGENVENVLRAWFYIWTTLLREEDAQKKGVVIIMYMVGMNSSVMPVARKLRSRRRAMPIKLVVHYCYDNKGIRPVIAVQKLFLLSKTHRARLRSHFGNHEEVMFKLQTYGIPVSNCHIPPDGSVSLVLHQEWLTMQKGQEEEQQQQRHLATTLNGYETDRSDEEDNDEESIITVEENDVLFGKDKKTQEHHGNLVCNHLIQVHQEKYEQASKFVKTDIAERILTTVHSEYGGRFLKFNKKEACWEIVERKVAREKISHTFRRIRNQKKMSPVANKLYSYTTTGTCIQSSPTTTALSSLSSTKSKRIYPSPFTSSTMFDSSEEVEKGKCLKKSRGQLH